MKRNAIRLAQEVLRDRRKRADGGTDEWQSTGRLINEDDSVNWGNPEVASDFFRADKEDLRRRREAERDVGGGDAPPSAPRVSEGRQMAEPRVSPPKQEVADGDAPPEPDTFRMPAQNVPVMAGATPPLSSDLDRGPLPPAMQAVANRYSPPEYKEALTDEQRQALALEQWKAAGRSGTPDNPNPAPPPAAAPAPIVQASLTTATPQQTANDANRQPLRFAPTEGAEKPAPAAAPTSAILAAIRFNESRNKPTAQNPRSSAGGLYQFLDSTWGSVLRRMDPQQFGRYNDRQLRSLKTDPRYTDLQHSAADFLLTKDIAPRLEKAGIPLTPGSAYLSWFQGPAGAIKTYTAPDNATVSQVFPRTVAANSNMRFNGKSYANWTMSDLRQWADTKMAQRMQPTRAPLRFAPSGYEEGGRVKKDNPNDWLQFAGKNQEDLPTGVPISEESSAVLKPMGVDLPQEAKSPLITRAQAVARLIKSDQEIAPDSDSSLKIMDPEERAANLAKFMSRSSIKNTQTNDPIRLYHATTQPNLEALKPGGFDPEISGPAIWLSPYADKQPAWHNTGGGSNYREGANVMPVYADIQTPLVLDTPEMIDWAQKVFAGGSREFPQLMHPEWRKALIDEGYDGIIYGGPKSKEYALHGLEIGQQPSREEEILALHQRQLKSATGNSGDFDMGKHRLSESSGGRVGYANEGAVRDPDDPRQWLEFGGQEMDRAPAGLPIGQAVGTSTAGHIGAQLADATELAHQAATNQLPPDYFHTEEGIERAFNAASAPMLGSFALAPVVGPTVKSGETALSMFVPVLRDDPALALAKEMLAKGKSKDEIWREVGMRPGPESHFGSYELESPVPDKYGRYQRVGEMPETPEPRWFKEISDENLKLSRKPEEDELIWPGSGINMKNEAYSVEHPELKAQFPEFEQLNRSVNVNPVHMNQGAYSSSGEYAPGKFGKSLQVFAENPEQARSISAHELQHFVADVGGLEQGNNPSNPDIINFFHSIRNEAKQTYESISSELSKFADDSYKQALKEFNIRPNTPQAMELRNKVAEEARKIYYETEPEKMQALDRSRYIISRITDPYDLYQHMYGEALARSTQERLHMTPEQRRATPPEFNYHDDGDTLIPYTPIPENQLYSEKDLMDFKFKSSGGRTGYANTGAVEGEQPIDVGYVDPMGNVAYGDNKDNRDAPGYKTVEAASDLASRFGATVGEPMRKAAENYLGNVGKAWHESGEYARQGLENTVSDKGPLYNVSGPLQYGLGSVGQIFSPLTGAAMSAGDAATQLSGNPEIGKRLEFVAGFADPTHAGSLKSFARSANEVVPAMAMSDMSRRGFLKGFGAGVAGAALPKKAVEEVISAPSQAAKFDPVKASEILEKISERPVPLNSDLVSKYADPSLIAEHMENFPGAYQSETQNIPLWELTNPQRSYSLSQPSGVPGKTIVSAEDSEKLAQQASAQIKAELETSLGHRVSDEDFAKLMQENHQFNSHVQDLRQRAYEDLSEGFSNIETDLVEEGSRYVDFSAKQAGGKPPKDIFDAIDSITPEDMAGHLFDVPANKVSKLLDEKIPNPLSGEEITLRDYLEERKQFTIEKMYDLESFEPEEFRSIQKELKNVWRDSAKEAKTTQSNEDKKLLNLAVEKGQQNESSGLEPVQLAVNKAKETLELPSGKAKNEEYIPKNDPQRKKNLEEWFGESVVTNQDGTPKTVYHGSGSDFSVFKPSATGEFGPGIYATDLADEASAYAGTHPEGTGQNVMPVHIRMEQPFVAKDPSEFWEKFGGKTDAEAMENAKRAGYDGVIIERPYTIYDEKRKQFYPTGKNHTHYVVFDPGQIKSATGNKGTFSLKDTDITKNSGGTVDRAMNLSKFGTDAVQTAVNLARQHRGRPENPRSTS